MGDREIIIGLKEGNTAAYRQLFLSFYTVVFRFLFKMIQDKNEAEDIVQDINNNETLEDIITSFCADSHIVATRSDGVIYLGIK